MNDLENVPISFSAGSDKKLISLLLYGDDTVHEKESKCINVNYKIY